MFLILIFNSRKNKLYLNGLFVIIGEMTSKKKKKTTGDGTQSLILFLFFSAEWEQSFDILERTNLLNLFKIL